MVLLVWFVIGVLTGWLAGQVLRNKGFGPIRYGVVGVVGGRWPLSGPDPQGSLRRE